MLHTDRIWCVADVEGAGELAEKLTEHSWTLCTGFRLDNCYFLNDSTTEDSIVEFGVVVENDGEFEQVESITFGWCTKEKAERYIREALAGEFSGKRFRVERKQLQTPQEHGSCELCA